MIGSIGPRVWKNRCLKLWGSVGRERWKILIGIIVLGSERTDFSFDVKPKFGCNQGRMGSSGNREYSRWSAVVVLNEEKFRSFRRRSKFFLRCFSPWSQDSEILSNYFKNIKRDPQNSFKLLQKYNKSGCRDSFKLLKNLDTRGPQDFSNYFKNQLKIIPKIL